MHNGKILVTGGSGHTGRRLLTRLADSGYAVRALTRQPVRIPLELRKRMEIFRGSLDGTKEALEALSGCTAVIAVTHIRFAPPILDAMRADGVRRGIFMSSTRRFTKFPEETAQQVIAGEEAVRASGLDCTIIRASMIYGGRQDRNMQTLLAALQRWPAHPLVGGGRMLWQPVFTHDVVSAIVAALERSETIGKDYTVAGPQPISYAEMVRTILQEAKLRRLLIPIPFGLASAGVALMTRLMKHPPVKREQIERLKEDKVFDIADARRDLGFDPISFREGIRRKLDGTA
jgi:nucleoside-diphosphate-sugar epimerase